jgi:hypothetical protein
VKLKGEYPSSVDVKISLKGEKVSRKCFFYHQLLPVEFFKLKFCVDFKFDDPIIQKSEKNCQIKVVIPDFRCRVNKS